MLRLLFKLHHCSCQSFLASNLPQRYRQNTGVFRHLATPVTTSVWLQQRFKGTRKQGGVWQRQAAHEKRAKIFGKLSMEIMRTVREKGPDPKRNPTLEALRIRARNVGMPKENVENAIKKAQRGGSADIDSNILVQAKGPDKSLLMIDVITSNAVRSIGEIRRILKRNNGSLVEDNSLVYLFDHKGVLTIDSASDTSFCAARLPVRVWRTKLSLNFTFLSTLKAMMSSK